MLSGSALLGVATAQPPPPDRPAQPAPVAPDEDDAEASPVTPAQAPAQTSQSQQSTTSGGQQSSNTLATNARPALTNDTTEDTGTADKKPFAASPSVARPAPQPIPVPEPPPPDPPPPDPTGGEGGSHRSGVVEETKEGPANPRSLSTPDGLAGAVSLAALADAGPGMEDAANEPSSPVDPALSPNARPDMGDAEGQPGGAGTVAAQVRPDTQNAGGQPVGATTFQTELVVGEEEAALPSVDAAALLGLSLPANLAALDAALASFLSGLDQLADSLPGPDHPAYWVLTVTLALTACEIGRRQLRRVGRTAVPAWL